MAKGIRVEVFVENAPGFVLYLAEQKLTRKHVRDYILSFLEEDSVAGSFDKDACAAVVKNNFTFRTTPLPDEGEPREIKREDPAMKRARHR
jgi:hypothetical protein